MTVPDIWAKKEAGERITVLTAYDALTGRLVDEAGVDMILVGDSLAMVLLGYETTLPVTMDEMIHHTRAVRRGAPQALIVADMPFGSFQGNVDEAVANAVRFLKEAGADAVKLEGGIRVVPTIARMVELGIPVMGHIGLTPQSVRKMGGYKVQGREDEQRRQLLEDAKALDDAGVFSIVIEGVPAELGTEITAAVEAPTIGIGAGPGCDGQVLVIHDLLGFVPDFKPKFVKRYANLAEAATSAIKHFCAEVRSGAFPDDDHSYN